MVVRVGVRVADDPILRVRLGETECVAVRVDDGMDDGVREGLDDALGAAGGALLACGDKLAVRVGVKEMVLDGDPGVDGVRVDVSEGDQVGDLLAVLPIDTDRDEVADLLGERLSEEDFDGDGDFDTTAFTMQNWSTMDPVGEMNDAVSVFPVTSTTKEPIVSMPTTFAGWLRPYVDESTRPALPVTTATIPLFGVTPPGFL